MPDNLDMVQVVFDSSPDSVVIAELSGQMLYVNPAGRAMVGMDRDQSLESIRTLDFFSVADLRTVSSAEKALMTTGHWRGVTQIMHFHTGEPIPVSMSGFVLTRPSDQLAVVVYIARKRNAAIPSQAAADAAEQYATEQKAIADLSQLALDGDRKLLLDTATMAAATITGVDRALIISRNNGLHLQAATGQPDTCYPLPDETNSLMGHALQTQNVVVCRDRMAETRFETSTMEAYGMRSGVAVPIAGTDGPWGTLSVHCVEPRDYLDREVLFLQTIAGVLSSALRRFELDRQLHERSMHDVLTGLPNRVLAYESIDDALARAQDSTLSVAVLLLDIDDFKIINDSLGHDAGDRALVQFAHRLSAAIRPQDTLARLGGDEFLIVCEQIEGADHARKLAKAVSDAITVPDGDQGLPTPLSASIGVAIADSGSTRRDMIHRADLAMYRAKDTGLGGFAVFDHADIYDAERVRTLSVDLRNALRQDEMVLHYQPLMDIETDRVVAMEALAQWHHPTLGRISPSEFVAVAERTGLADELGTWALTTACAQAAFWRTFGDVSIRVNVSALQLRNSKFPAQIAAILAETSLPAEALGLEITETVWVADPARIAGTLDELHRMGVSILLDDMGRGHTSIAYLERYSIFSCFKIDKSYIAALPGPRPHAIVSAIVGIAKAYGVTVVGDGVETQEQLAALRDCGCELAQGNYVGPPVDVRIATAILRDAAPRAVL